MNAAPKIRRARLAWTLTSDPLRSLSLKQRLRTQDGELEELCAAATASAMAMLAKRLRIHRRNGYAGSARARTRGGTFLAAPQTFRGPLKTRLSSERSGQPWHWQDSEKGLFRAASFKNCPGYPGRAPRPLTPAAWFPSTAKSVLSSLASGYRSLGKPSPAEEPRHGTAISAIARRYIC